MIKAAGALTAILSFVFAYFSYRHETKTPIKTRLWLIKGTRVLLAIAGALGIVFMLGLYTPEATTTHEALAWRTDIERALHDAKDGHKPAIIDAWAEWCAACKELGEKTLTAPRVQAALRGFVRIKFDMTKIATASRRLKKLGYNVQNLPAVLFIRPSGREWSCRVNGYVKPARFLDYVTAFRQNRPGCPQKTGLLQHGFWIALLIAFAAGFGVSLTPCVFPLLPGIAGILSGWPTEALAMRTRILRSSLFVVGMAVVYTALGLASGLLGWGFGSMMSHPWVTGGIAVLFGLLGLSYLGLFTTDLPGPLKNLLVKARESNAGLLLMGGGIGLAAAPCSGPVTVAILAYIAASASPWAGGVLMFAFALGIGALFFVMGVFSALLEHIPRRGLTGAMVEFTFAVALFVTAIYYGLLAI